VLGRRASLWVSFGVSLHTLWTSAAPALSYRLYIDQWQLSPIETMSVFAIYPVFVVATLILFGGLSDQVGRRLTMLAALFCSLAGTLMLADAEGLSWLLAARAIMGVAVGLASGSSTAAILEFSEDPARAVAATNVAQAIGFALALVLGGAVIQYLPWPLRLNFLMLAAVIVVLIAAVWFLPQGAASAGGWSPRLPYLPAESRVAFSTAAFAGVCAFASGAALLSLGGQIAHDLVGSNNTLISGTILASFAIISAAVTGVGRQLSPRLALFVGVGAMNIGVATLWLAIFFRGLILLVEATSLMGAGYALLFISALNLVNSTTPVQHRGGVLSALYLVGYLSMGSFALSLGVVAQFSGLATAVAMGSVVLASFGFIALFL
jgi:MFS family permease